MNTVLIVDGFSLVFRAFYGIPDTMVSPKGEPTNAIYGFVTQLMRAIGTLKPSHVCVCLDSPGPTFRAEQYPLYKANRSEPPDLLRRQLAVFEETLVAMGLSVWRQSGMEADDLIGSLAKQVSAESERVFILSSDMDLLQLVDAYVHVVMPVKRELVVMNVEAVIAKYKIRPDQIIDYKALRGDASDNIPGVAGIGDKTAVKLLTHYENLMTIYDQLDHVQTASVQKKLRAGKESAAVSQRLATLRTDCEPLATDAYRYAPDADAMRQVFEALGFESLLTRYGLSVPEAAPVADASDGTYQRLDTVAAVEAWLPAAADGFALDVETSGADPMTAVIVGVAMASLGQPKTAVHVAGSVLEIALERMKPVLADPNIPKVCHHAQDVYRVLRTHRIALNGCVFDTMVAAFLLDSAQPLDLKALTKAHLSIAMGAQAGGRADMTARLYRVFQPQLERNGLQSLFERIEMPLIPVLGDMANVGVSVDAAALLTLNKTLLDEMTALTQSIHSHAGSVFNINSTQQLGVVLFETLGLPVIKKNKTGPSTDNEVLVALEDKHPIISYMMRYRMVDKLQSTYVSALPKLVHTKTGRIHASFHQTIAVTGRLSSSNPNLQNIPIRTPEGAQIRGAFCPSTPDSQILSADYSQIELRLLAHFCEDPALMAAYRANGDIHAQTASQLFQVPLDSVTKTQRNIAKTVNFGILYGQSPYGLSKQLRIARSEAKQLVDAYFNQFPAIRGFIDSTIEQARQDGGVRTLWGRWRALPDLTSGNRVRRQHAERTAVNTRIQGTAADIMKIAMIAVHDGLKVFKSQLIIQVHDEVVIDVVKAESEAVAQVVVAAMQSAAELKVPLVVDVAMGDSWQAC